MGSNHVHGYADCGRKGPLAANVSSGSLRLGQTKHDQRPAVEQHFDANETDRLPIDLNTGHCRQIIIPSKREITPLNRTQPQCG